MKFKVAALFLTLFSAQLAFADAQTFGGKPEEYPGDGDQQPPTCVVDAPRAATTPFFIKWNCSDDDSPGTDIQTELWIYRKGADTAGRKIEEFLGFPAAAFIDENQLKVTTFTEALPVSFKLLARDRAGNITISPILTVRERDNSITNCDVLVVTEATESTGGTTGTPSMETFIENAPVTSNQVNTTNIALSTTQATQAVPCDIDTICTNTDDLTFTASITLSETSEATGTLTIPGSIFAELSGSVVQDSQVVTRIDMNGTTKIDGVDATVTLTCTR